MGTVRIANGHVLRPDLTVTRAEILYDDHAGAIERIDRTVPDADRTLDATDCLLMPGLVNAHTHVAMALLRGISDDKPVHVWLEEDIWPVEAELSTQDIRAGTELAALELIKSGTTTICDMYFEVPTIASVIAESGLRARLGYGMVTMGKDETAAKEEIQRGLELARRLDGQADGRIQTAFMPHALTTVDPDLLAEVLPAVRQADIPVHFHANENEAFVDPIIEQEGQRPIEFADDLGLLAPGDSIAHGVHLDQTEIDVLAERGVSVIHCPASNMKLASGIAPVTALHDAGVTVGLGTDGAASNNDLDLFDELRDAAMIGKIAENDARAIPASTALQMATGHGAKALDVPGGALVEGGVADIAVVDFSAPNLRPIHDHVSHLVYAASGANVRHTICDGTILMQDRVVQTLDEGAILERAETRAHELIDRVGIV